MPAAGCTFAEDWYRTQHYKPNNSTLLASHNLHLHTCIVGLPHHNGSFICMQCTGYCRKFGSSHPHISPYLPPSYRYYSLCILRFEHCDLCRVEILGYIGCRQDTNHTHRWCTWYRWWGQSPYSLQFQACSRSCPLLGLFDSLPDIPGRLRSESWRMHSWAAASHIDLMHERSNHPYTYHIDRLPPPHSLHHRRHISVGHWEPNLACIVSIHSYYSPSSFHRYIDHLGEEGYCDNQDIIQFRYYDHCIGEKPNCRYYQQDNTHTHRSNIPQLPDQAPGSAQ